MTTRGQDVQHYMRESLPLGVMVGVLHEETGDAVAAVSGPDVEAPHLKRVGEWGEGQAHASNRLITLIGDEQGSGRGVARRDVFTLTPEPARKLRNGTGNGAPALAKRHSHVLEDQADRIGGALAGEPVTYPHGHILPNKPSPAGSLGFRDR